MWDSLSLAEWFQILEATDIRAAEAIDSLIIIANDRETHCRGS